jgi:hypothetical protein
MIEKLSGNSGVSPAANLTQKAASTKTLCQTPFGDVMVDELSTANLAGIFSGRRQEAQSSPTVPQTAVPATMKTTAAASTVQTAAVISTVKAAVAASTQQTAAATATVPAAAAAEAPDDDAAPTAESVFGPSPWVTNPTGTAPDGSSYDYNPMYFATEATAAQVAQMVGGTVVASDQIADGGSFVQQQPNQMVQLADGKLINPGLVASFYTHGYPQSYIDLLVQNETQGT